MNQQKHRIFIAAEIHNKEIINNIITFQDKFKLKGIKLTKKHMFHFTLHFLGDTNSELIPDVIKILKSVSIKRFDLNLEQCGVFPTIDKPRVIWIGIDKGKKYLINLHEEIKKPLQDLGFTLDSRRYSPHLTIARVKSLESTSLITRLIKDNSSVDLGICDINHIHLYESELTPEGSIYTKLYTKELM